MSTSSLFFQGVVSSTGQLLTDLFPIVYLFLGIGFALWAGYIIVRAFQHGTKKMFK